MYYVDDILMLEGGLQVEPKALLPIGIANNSLCWGLEVVAAPRHDSRQGGGRDKGPQLPHLLISAFYPANWHILFRIVIELENKMGNLAAAARVLRDKQFNILSTQCGPSGHHHATWHIIGEALELKNEVNRNLDGVIEDYFESGMSAFNEENRTFRDMLTVKVSEKLLVYSKTLVRAIEEANGVGRRDDRVFLHQRFADVNTLLYIGESWGERADDFKELWTRAVTCDWLQNLAVFRVYSQARKKQANKVPGGGPPPRRGRSRASYQEPISFRYDAANALLRPDGNVNRERYAELLKDYLGGQRRSPLRALGGFNHREHYLRVTAPTEREGRRQFSISVPYTVKFDSQRGGSKLSSIGLLHDVASKLAAKDIDLEYVANATTELTSSRETGFISLIGERNDERGGEDSEPQFDEYMSGLKAELNTLDDDPAYGLELGDIDIARAGAKKVFVSAPLKWIKTARPNFQSDISDALRKHGLAPVWGTVQQTPDASNKDGDRGLPHYVMERILKSHAFIQIVPKLPNKPRTDWLLLELGIAIGANKPRALCVDQTMLMKWPPTLGHDWMKFPFTTLNEDKAILEEIKDAFVYLKKVVYGDYGR